MDGALGILPPSHLSTCYCLTPILCQLHLTSHCAQPLCTRPILTRLQRFLLCVCVRTPTLPGLYWLAFIGHIYWWTCSIVPRLSFAKESRRRLLATSRQFCFFRMFLDHSSRLNACRHCRVQQLIHSYLFMFQVKITSTTPRSRVARCRACCRPTRHWAGPCLASRRPRPSSRSKVSPGGGTWGQSSDAQSRE